MRKSTWSHGPTSLASRIEEPAHAETHWTTVIWNAPTNVKCSKCGKTNHTTDHCWLLTKKPPSKPSGNSQPQKRQPYAKKQKADAINFVISLRTRRKVTTKQVHILLISSWHTLQASLRYQKMNPQRQILLILKKKKQCILAIYLHPHLSIIMNHTIMSLLWILLIPFK